MRPCPPLKDLINRPHESLQGWLLIGAFLAVCALILAIVNPRTAVDNDNSNLPYDTVSFAGGEVAIWQSVSARQEGEAMIRAGMSNKAAMYYACVVPDLTPVTVIRQEGSVFSASVSWDVLVTDGDHRGCEGNVSNDRMKFGHR